MKKLLIMAMAVGAGCCLQSCGSDDKEVLNNKSDYEYIKSSEKPANEAWAAEDQLIYLDKVGAELTEKAQAADFQSLWDYYNDIAAVAETDISDVEEWAMKALENAMKEMTVLGESTAHFVSDKKSHNNTISNYSCVFALSQFTGHWTYNEITKKWTREDANDLKFTYVNSKKETLEVSLTKSGKEQAVHVYTDYDGESKYKTDEDGNIVKDEDGNKVMEGVYDALQYQLSIPEKVVLTAKRDKKMVAELELNVKLGSLAGNEFNVQKSTLTSSAKLSLDAGFAICIDQLSYKNNLVAEQSKLMKGTETLVALTAGLKTQGVPDYDFTKLAWDDGYTLNVDEISTSSLNATDIYVNANILGKVQVKGSLTDVMQLVQLEDALEPAKKLIAMTQASKLNGISDIALYFNNGSAKQLEFRFDVAEISGGANDGLYEVVPTLYCPQNQASYGVEEFFAPEVFTNTQAAIYKLYEAFKKMTGEE